MKIIKVLKQDVVKSLINMEFMGATLISCFLCFTAPAYHDKINDKSYSIFEVFFSFDRGFINSHTDFSSIVLFNLGLSGYITMFIPIIAAFPFTVSFCAERNTGLMRFAITRSGKMRYYLSKFAVSILSGGLAIMLGLALFGIIVWIAFPTLISYGLSSEQLKLIIPDDTVAMIFRNLLAAFIYGAFSTLPAFFLSSFCKNPYIIICAPFMLIYVWNTTMNKIMSKAYEIGDYEIYEKLAPFMPDSPRKLAFIKFSEITPLQVKMLSFNGVYLLVLLIGFIVIMNLRTDMGN